MLIIRTLLIPGTFMNNPDIPEAPVGIRVVGIVIAAVLSLLGCAESDKAITVSIARGATSESDRTIACPTERLIGFFRAFLR